MKGRRRMNTEEEDVIRLVNNYSNIKRKENINKYNKREEEQ